MTGGCYEANSGASATDPLSSRAWVCTLADLGWPDGETRTRTDDTTVFRNTADDLEST
jgi:hypothetical protein